MKRAFIVALACLLPSAASAATISLAPSVLTTEVGKSFVVTVSAMPDAAAPLVTAKAALRFDGRMLNASSTSLGPLWIPLVQFGYDGVDNMNGTIDKTAGYPGGFTSSKMLATITFVAVAPGTTTLTLDEPDSFALNNHDADSLKPGAHESVFVTILPAPTGAQRLAQVLPIVTPLANASSTLRKVQTAAIAALTIDMPVWVWLLIIALGVDIMYFVQTSRKDI